MLNQVPASPSMRTVWVKTRDGHWQSGKIQIRLVSAETKPGCGDYVFRRYGIWVKHRGRWRQGFPRSRPWTHGSLGSAKVGAAKTSVFVLEDGTEVKRA